MAMIEIKNISKWYGNFQVLKDCSVEVEKGEVVVVCGPSGSGKSTLIKTVNALEPFQKGEIIVDGISVGDPKISINKSDIFFYKTRLVMQIKVNQKAIENSLHYNHEFAN